MNAWLCEKALSLVVASGTLLRAAGLVDPEALCPWGETVREFIRSEAWLVYHRACAFMAYATGGFPDDLDERCRQAFSDGPEAMEAYAREFASRKCEGWDLPNPNYHHAILAWPVEDGR